MVTDPRHRVGAVTGSPWTPENLSRALLAIADDRGHGLPRDMIEALRRAAGRMLDLAEIEARSPVAARPETRRCRGCGAPLPVQRMGRPRSWCGGRGRCAKSRAKSAGGRMAA